ncbi:cytochrome C oxidase subunit III [Candidatus Marinamargulisbacteria bacterium SCGC AG-410-N11]|nr:cytochrome C oxidase subunit III [Candidatus Marinamargulisbacteria bacterium SCGC AG-410-N11]
MNKEIKIKKHEVAHHFDNSEQEFNSAKLGMWAFLGQEILFFSGLFVAYIIFRMMHPEMFIYASKHLDWKMGALNTVILILSSFTMVMAVRSAQVNKLKQCVNYLIATFSFAGMFMVVKGFEYASKISHGYLPAKFFNAESAHESLHIFFGIYFTMTGLHGLHVLVGMGLIIWLIIKAKKGHFYEDYYTPLEMVGLYWHLVDLIWIFLFPLLYLIG